MSYFVFWVEYRRELRFPREGFSKRLETKTTFAPKPACFERKNPRKDGRTNIRDVHARWNKVQCLYLYSTDTAFTQHKHDKYSLQTKGQMPADKTFSKGTWNSKMTLGEFVARVIVLRFLLVKKNWCQSRPHTRFIVTTGPLRTKSFSRDILKGSFYGISSNIEYWQEQYWWVNPV